VQINLSLLKWIPLWPLSTLRFLTLFEHLVAKINTILSIFQGITLTEHLDSSQKADMRAYMSLVSNVLGNAELYLSWLDNVTLTEVTKPRYGSAYPWPLNHILAWQKKQQVYKKLAALGWTSKSLDEVLKNMFSSVCTAY
jgi:metaxin